MFCRQCTYPCNATQPHTEYAQRYAKYFQFANCYRLNICFISFNFTHHLQLMHLGKNTDHFFLMCFIDKWMVIVCLSYSLNWLIFVSFITTTASAADVVSTTFACRKLVIVLMAFTLMNAWKPSTFIRYIVYCHYLHAFCQAEFIYF